MKKLMSGIAHLAVFLAVLELTCRIDDRIRFGMPLMSRVVSSEDLREQSGSVIQGRPNARYQKWALNGLGLAIISAIAESHGGAATVVNHGRDGGPGLTVRVTIPLAPRRWHRRRRSNRPPSPRRFSRR